MNTHVVIVPTYNESGNIGPLVENIVSLNLGSHIVIVDDNSPDGTGELADRLAAAYPCIRVVHRPGKLGLGTAYRAGMQVGLSNGAAHLLTMDADFSHHPRYLPAMLAALEEFDVVIGSRYVSGGGTLRCTWPRRALSRGANLLARTALGLVAGDATAGFRGYRRAVLESIALDQIKSNGYSFLIEMLYYCQKKGWRVGEVPIVFENRQCGASKISKAEIFKALQTVLRLERDRLGMGRPAQG